MAALEYDRPLSTFGQFSNPEIDVTAHELGRTLQEAFEFVAS